MLLGANLINYINPENRQVDIPGTWNANISNYVWTASIHKFLNLGGDLIALASKRKSSI